MPDQHDFDHLPRWGTLTHRCIECGWPTPPALVSEAERARHARAHTRAHAQEVEKQRLANLAKARKTKAQIERENALAYSEGEG